MKLSVFLIAAISVVAKDYCYTAYDGYCGASYNRYCGNGDYCNDEGKCQYSKPLGERKNKKYDAKNIKQCWEDNLKPSLECPMTYNNEKCVKGEWGFSGEKMTTGCTDGGGSSNWCATEVDKKTKQYSTYDYCLDGCSNAESLDQCQTTIEEVPCVFPFKYNGVEHYGCTEAGGSTNWCATSVNENGEYANWNSCRKGCAALDFSPSGSCWKKCLKDFKTDVKNLAACTAKCLLNTCGERGEALESTSVPKDCQLVLGDLVMEANQATVELDHIIHVNGKISGDESKALESVSAANLISAGEIKFEKNPSLTAVDFPKLSVIAGDVKVKGNDLLKEFNLFNVDEIGDDVEISDNDKLEVVGFSDLDSVDRFEVSGPALKGVSIAELEKASKVIITGQNLTDVYADLEKLESDLSIIAKSPKETTQNTVDKDIVKDPAEDAYDYDGATSTTVSAVGFGLAAVLFAFN